MTFSPEIWKQQTHQKLKQAKDWLGRLQTQQAPYVVYGYLTSMALWPLVDALGAGQVFPVMNALGIVAGNVGGSLLANLIQNAKDRADLERQIRQQAAGSDDLRQALDAVLQALEVPQQAQAGLSEADRQWFLNTLQDELTQLGASKETIAILIGRGNVAVQDSTLHGRDRAIVGSIIGGDAISVDQHIYLLATEVAEKFWQPRQAARLSQEALQQATREYLAYLLDRYRYLDFKGLGMSDRVPLRLPLVEMYVPLKARIELPEGETWRRQALRLAGRAISPAEADTIGRHLSEPTRVLELLQQQLGLIILGDPGAGKTTFLKYLALRLARGDGEALALGSRLPVLLPLSAYANALAERDIPLARFIPAYYRDRGIDLPLGPMLEEALVQGGAMLLLDGLDEVKNQSQRSLVVDRVVDFFSLQQRRGNKFILTSRIVGYREVRPTGTGLAECTLVDFEDEEIKTFIARWTGALERAARGSTPAAAEEAAQEEAELLLAVEQNSGVRRLAANPLLLTILALMKRQGITLPERRVELYQKYVEALLKTWNLARGLDRRAARDLDVVETIKVLAPLALWMHQASPGVGLVKREAMRRELIRIYTGRQIAEPEQAARRFLQDVREHASLLLERGAGEYGFIHLTFQEYLAAVALAQQGQSDVEPVVEALAQRVGDETWREASLLTVGYLGIIQQRDQAAGELVWRLIQRSPGEPGQGVVLAGEAVADTGPGGVTVQCRDKVVTVLARTLRAARHVKSPLRAAAGRTLARLGDPRPAATTLKGMTFCYVPAGPFIMGSPADEQADDDEKPLHEQNIPYGYWIGCYPVTVAQFTAFVESSGYRPRDEDSLRDPANQPVRYVTWHDALAFCRWLTETWHEKDLIPKGWEATLPSEAEWEKAARGGLKRPESPLILPIRGIKPGQQPELRLIENEDRQREFPWGNEADSNRANYDDTGLGRPSTVGCFPGGASPYGCEEMSGNVWEWTRSHSKEYPYDPTDGREDLEAGDDVLRVLRGGAFNGYDRNVRCAVRSWSGPYSRIINVGFGFRVVLVSPS